MSLVCEKSAWRSTVTEQCGLRAHLLHLNSAQTRGFQCVIPDQISSGKKQKLPNRQQLCLFIYCSFFECECVTAVMPCRTAGDARLQTQT